MPAPSRPRLDPTDDWRQLDLLVQFPEQRTYELIRPVVLFGHSPAERARQTGAPARTLSRQAARFEREGMTSLFEPARSEPHSFLDPAIRDAILSLKADHPGLNTNEITAICWVRFGHRPSTRTVKRVLATHPLPSGQRRRYAPYHQIADPAEARLAIIRLHLEGWNAKSIASYLATSRVTVHATLRRWVEEGVAGLADKSHAAKHPARKVTFKAMLAIKDLQENPAHLAKTYRLFRKDGERRKRSVRGVARESPGRAALAARYRSTGRIPSCQQARTVKTLHRDCGRPGMFWLSVESRAGRVADACGVGADGYPPHPADVRADHGTQSATVRTEETGTHPGRAEGDAVRGAATASVLERGHPPPRHGLCRHEGLLRIHFGEL